MHRRRARAFSAACRLVGALGLGAALSFPQATLAQVIEIAPDGGMAVYDRPAVFSAQGAVAIETRPAQPRSKPTPGSVPQAMNAAAEASDLSAELIEAVAWRESRLKAGVVSRAGAVGEMQLMPATARELGVDAFDTAQNFRGGADYLRRLMKRYDGDLIRTLAAYNAGPGAVDRYKGVPPYKETQAYVASILDRLSGRVSLTGVEGRAR